VRRIALAAAVCLGVAGLSPAARAQSIEGTWYGRGYQPDFGRNEDFIIHRWPDGRYEATYRYYEGCIVIDEQRQSGTWSMADANTVRVITNSIEGQKGYWPDDYYRILELTAERYRYLHIPTGVELASRRVDDDFTFPKCGLTS
jgi:hypothetical protein